MDWNPLTWTFATTFFGISLLKWGIVVGTIIFLALVRKFIMGTRTIHKVHAHTTTPTSTVVVAETTAAPALTPDAIEIVAAAAVKETPAMKQKVAKVKAFKRAIVVAKKKRKARVKKEKLASVKPVEVTPLVAAQPVANIKTESVVVQPTPAVKEVTRKPVAKIVVAKPAIKKVKKKTTKAKAPIVEAVQKVEAAPTTTITAKPKAEASQKKTEDKTASAKETTPTAPTKSATAKAKPIAKVKTIAKESKTVVSSEAEEKTPASTTQPLRTRNPGFI